MKTLILATILALPLPALAHVSCSGELDRNKTIVNVTINTVGTMGGVTGGTVTVTPVSGPTETYEIRAEEIPQFFEFVDENNQATVGLAAYVELNYPVTIRYVGKNFDGDLTKELRDPSRRKAPGNLMRVWKGPGFPGDQQYTFRDAICTVTLDP